MPTYITFSVPGEQGTEFKETLRDVAMKQGLSLSELICEALVDYLERQVDKPGEDKANDKSE
jgi:hypothetical protein